MADGSDTKIVSYRWHHTVSQFGLWMCERFFSPNSGTESFSDWRRWNNRTNVCQYMRGLLLWSWLFPVMWLIPVLMMVRAISLPFMTAGTSATVFGLFAILKVTLIIALFIGTVVVTIWCMDKLLKFINRQEEKNKKKREKLEDEDKPVPPTFFQIVVRWVSDIHDGICTDIQFVNDKENKK